MHQKSPSRIVWDHDDVIKWKHFPRYWPFVRPVTRSFHVFFDLRLNKPLSKQSWGWWFETLSRPLWRHCNAPLPPPPPLTANLCNVAYMAGMAYDAINELWNTNIKVTLMFRKFFHKIIIFISHTVSLEPGGGGITDDTFNNISLSGNSSILKPPLGFHFMDFITDTSTLV